MRNDDSDAMTDDCANVTDVVRHLVIDICLGISFARVKTKGAFA